MNFKEKDNACWLIENQCVGSAIAVPHGGLRFTVAASKWHLWGLMQGRQILSLAGGTFPPCCRVQLSHYSPFKVTFRLCPVGKLWFGASGLGRVGQVVLEKESTLPMGPWRRLHFCDIQTPHL